tara:strand:+ start:103 stop:501 length:399 start_codon:yes stop_codon:yes gene_type:complete
MIKLCYKSYEYKLNLSACKFFHEKTGKDLQYTLLLFLDACRTSAKMEYIERLKLFHGVISFKEASILFYSLIKETDKSIPIDEIEDAMFRVSWIPSKVDDADLCQPWPLVLVDLATQVSEYYAELDKKKAVI